MTIPLVVLGVMSVVGGWIGISESFTQGRIPNWFEHFLHPAMAAAPQDPSYQVAVAEPLSHTLEIGLAVLALGLALIALIAAYRYYLQKPLWKPPSALVHKYWVDQTYDRALIQPIKVTSTRLLWQVFDVRIIDGAVNGTAALVKALGRGLRRTQTGLVRSYVVMIFLGALVVIAYFIFGGR